jgi:hypothetical protein
MVGLFGLARVIGGFNDVREFAHGAAEAAK